MIVAGGGFHLLAAGDEPQRIEVALDRQVVVGKVAVG